MTLSPTPFRNLKVIVLFTLIVLIAGIVASTQLLSTNSKHESKSGASAQESTKQVPYVQSRYVGLLDQKIDYSNPKNLAVSLSFPLFANGLKPYPTSFTGGGVIDRALASEQYYQSKERANRIAIQNGSETPPNEERNFADCGAFVATVLVNTVDPDYPGLLVYKQRDYVKDPTNGWTKIGNSKKLTGLKLRPGDVFMTEAENRNGHTWIWLGNVAGESDIIADASYGTDESQTAHLPALRKNPLRGKAADSRGRSYDIWRFTGK